MIKKSIVILITTVGITSTIAACDSGGSGSSNSLNITAVNATPPGSAPAQNLGAGMGSGSVYDNIESNGNPLYLLGNSNGSVYAPLIADTTVTSGSSIIGGWLVSTNVLFGPAAIGPESVADYFTATTTSSWNTTANTAAWQSAQLTNVNRTICFGNPVPGSAGCAGSNAPTGARLVTSYSGNTQIMFVGYGVYGTPGLESVGYNILSVNGGSGTPPSSESYVSLAPCVASGSKSATTVSAVAASSFESTPLFIAGTNSGDVCVGIIKPDAESNAFSSAGIVNMTAMAKADGASYSYESSVVTTAESSYAVTGGYNSGGAVNSIAATPQGVNNTSTVIAWTQGSSQVYSVTHITGESYIFANLTNSQYYSNVPSNVSVIYVDFQNNIYVATFENQAYVLPNGSNSWLSAQIPNPIAGSQIYNFSAGYNGNVYVYTANGGTLYSSANVSESSSAVYSLSF